MATSIYDFDKVDPRFIDAVFPSFPEYVAGEISPDDPDERAELCAAAPSYEDLVTPIPTAEWVEMSRETERQNAGIEWLIRRIMNQGQEGACVYNMLAMALELCQAKMFGLAKVILMSAISGYQQNASSAGSGSTVNGALAYAKSKGLVPLDNEENRKLFGDAVMPHTGFRSRRPAGADAAAANFKCHEYYVVRSYEGIVTAGLRGDPIGIGREGHSILYIRPTFTTDSVNSLKFIYPNSWSENWGFAAAGFKGGFGADTPRQVQKSAGYGFVVASMVDPTFRHK